MHEHKQCKHNLKYCSICDIVYCEDCKKEWRDIPVCPSWDRPTVPDVTGPYPFPDRAFCGSGHTTGVHL